MTNLRRHTSLMICTLIAVALFIMFLIFQHRESSLLKLDSKWLIVAGVPILIGLIIGNYIKSFKGFGIELETLLGLSIGTMDLLASDATEALPGDAKGSVKYLNQLSDAKKEGIQRLAFTSNKPHYYKVHAVMSYLIQLNNLKYVEIQDNNKKFQALIPIDFFKSNGIVQQQIIESFIHALEQNTLNDLPGDNLITESVSENEALLDVLKKARNSFFGVLPVVSSNRVLIGVVTVNLIEKRITNEVIAMRNAA